MNPLYIGIGLICLCKLVFATQDVIIKQMSDGFPVHQIMVVRAIVSLALLALFIRILESFSALASPNRGALMLRGVLLFFSFTAFYLGLSALTLTAATALFFTAPFFITLLSIPVLGERVGIRRWIGISVGFLGVLVVLRPDSGSVGLEALLPVLAAFLYSVAQLMARKFGISDSAAVMVFYANVSYLVLGLAMAAILWPIEASGESGRSLQFLLRSWQVPGFIDGLLITLTGVTGAVGFWLSTQAYRICEVNRIAPLEYSMLIWIPLLGYLVFAEVPDRATLLGTAIIVAAGLYVVRREEVVAERPITPRSISRAR